MRILSVGLMFGALLVGTSSAADAQKSPNALPAPTVSPAIDGVLAAFQSHPLVGLINNEGRDNHGLARRRIFIPRWCATRDLRARSGMSWWNSALPLRRKLLIAM